MDKFEAGALSKSVTTARVIPVLFGLAEADVPPPLSHFMMKQISKDGISEIVVTLNNHLPDDRRVDDASLLRAVEALWPDFEESLSRLQDQQPQIASRPERSERAILEEILQLVRAWDQEASRGIPVMVEENPDREAIAALVGSGRLVDLGTSVEIHLTEEAWRNVELKIQPHIFGLISVGKSVSVVLHSENGITTDQIRYIPPLLSRPGGVDRRRNK